VLATAPLLKVDQRRRHGPTSLLIKLRGQDQVDGQWTVAGLVFNDN
jgi:hypothetical protein